jgi:hypothetical protein
MVEICRVRYGMVEMGAQSSLALSRCLPPSWHLDVSFCRYDLLLTQPLDLLLSLRILGMKLKVSGF